MNLNQLQYFISLAETLNFTRAAQACYISQTAMTQQIQSLEKTVGVPLFIRDKHHVELTAAGKIYLGEARAIIAKSNEAIKLARLASEGVTGELKIGFASGFGQSDLTQKLRTFHDTYPGVKLSLFSGNTSTLFEDLSRGDCDLIFTVSQRNREYQNMNFRYLKSYPVMAVVSAEHPLAGKKKLTYQELQGEQFIMMEPSDRPKDLMEESVLIYEKGGYYPDVVAMEKNPETLLLMISVGIGISILPEYIVKPYQRDNNVSMIPLVDEDGQIDTIDLEIDWMADNINPALEHILNTVNM